MKECKKQTQATSVKTKYWFGGKKKSKKQYDRLIKAQQTGRNNKGRKNLIEWNVFTNDEIVTVDTTGKVTPEDIVRIFVSYDIRWSKRGNGKQYDSLNGYGAIIGYFSGKVLDLATQTELVKLMR
ncbi:hypothetical protein PV327_011670, partial [Microctonus hyperodae]